MIRVNIILGAYFKYREIAVGHGDDLTPEQILEFNENKLKKFQEHEIRIFSEL